MRLIAEPSLDQWEIAARGGASRVIATGHQAWLWHPGILAKDLAMVHAARRWGGQSLHLVVDHDAHEAGVIELPVADGERLGVAKVRYGEMQPHVPTGAQPALEAGKVVASLEGAWRSYGSRLQVDLGPLIDAWREAGGERTLAEQVTGVLQRLWEPVVGDVAVMYSSVLWRDEGFRELVAAMLADARECVQRYNEVVSERPEAGLAKLLTTRERVELPLWLVRWGQPRERVYADLIDSPAILTDGHGRELSTDDEKGADMFLAPRALMQTAVMRRYLCNLFIHGKGGGVYDRVMEQWWRAWRGEEEASMLAPMAVVSADVHLSLEAHVSDEKELRRAKWYRHHAPHNVDRIKALRDGLAERKRELLVHMDDDRDHERRRRAFEELHQINAQLVAEHPRVVEDADRRLRETEAGVANRAVVGKRDWCFGLYPREALAQLSSRIEAAFGSVGDEGSDRGAMMGEQAAPPG